MGHVEHTAICAAPVDFAFAYTSDYRNVPKWMLGIDKLDPVGDQTRGVGAVFETAVDLGPKGLQLRMEVVDWVDNEAVAFTITKALDADLVWRFESTDDGETRISAVTTYTIPGRLAGRMLDPIIQAFARAAVRHADKQLRAQIEERYAESRALSEG